MDAETERKFSELEFQSTLPAEALHLRLRDILDRFFQTPSGTQTSTIDMNRETLTAEVSGPNFKVRFRCIEHSIYAQVIVEGETEFLMMQEDIEKDVLDALKGSVPNGVLIPPRSGVA